MNAEYNFGMTALILMIVVLNLCHGIPHAEGSNSSEEIILADLQVDYKDGEVPPELKNALGNATLVDWASSDYGPKSGIPRLRKAISDFYSDLINHDLDPDSEVIVTVGATEALYIGLVGLSSPGDEWIIIEPFFTPFKHQVELAGAVPRFSTLLPTKTTGHIRAADWELDYDGLKSLINNRTRGIVFNNPNNPTGKSFNQTEIEFIADLAKRHNLYILADQVHEFTTDSLIRIASIPGMFERTLTMSSVSKAFNIPGWRVGWMYGPAKLISIVKNIHDDSAGFAGQVQQIAVSDLLENEKKSWGLANRDTVLSRKIENGRKNRRIMLKACREAGLLPIIPQGGYCMLVSWPLLNSTGIELSKYPGSDKGEKFANWMKQEIGVAGFTAGKYYSDEHRSLGFEHLRFCYLKSKETLFNAAKNLLQLKKFEYN